MRTLAVTIVLAACATPSLAHAACPWGYPVGDDPSSPAPLADNHPVGGMNLPQYGSHLGGDFWSGGGCTDLGTTVYAVADGEIVEIVDALGSYLDVVVIRHDDPQLGAVYSMYGHIARDDGLAEGDAVAFRQPIGSIADVLAYFSPCHLHFELLNQTAYDQGPFCNGCANAGYHVSPGYDQQAGVSEGVAPSGDPYIEVDDAIAGNWWFRVDEFLAARVDAQCGECGDGVCGGGEDFDHCAQDCEPCAWIGLQGATLEEDGPCFTYGGDPQYWNVQADAGHGGALRWTHTTDSAMVDNWGDWSFAFEQAGPYLVEVWIDDTYGQSTMAAYALQHEGVGETIALDQAAASGWAELGTFDFAAGGAQGLHLVDNTGEPFAQMIPIAFDAVRVTWAGGVLDDSGSADSGVADDGSMGPGGGEASAGDGVLTQGDDGGSGAAGSGSDGGPALPPGLGRGEGSGCGCRSDPGAGGAWWWLVVLAWRRGSSRPRCGRVGPHESAASLRRPR